MFHGRFLCFTRVMNWDVWWWIWWYRAKNMKRFFWALQMLGWGRNIMKIRVWNILATKHWDPRGPENGLLATFDDVGFSKCGLVWVKMTLASTNQNAFTRSYSRHESVFALSKHTPFNVVTRNFTFFQWFVCDGRMSFTLWELLSREQLLKKWTTMRFGCILWFPSGKKRTQCEHVLDCWSVLARETAKQTVLKWSSEESSITTQITQIEVVAALFQENLNRGLTNGAQGTCTQLSTIAYTCHHFATKVPFTKAINAQLQAIVCKFYRVALSPHWRAPIWTFLIRLFLFTWPQLGPFLVPACPPLTAINGY